MHTLMTSEVEQRMLIYGRRQSKCNDLEIFIFFIQLMISQCFIIINELSLTVR